MKGIDLTNCPSLKELHWAGNTNTFSTAQMNQALIAVAGTCTQIHPPPAPGAESDWKFFYPSGTGPGAPDFTIDAVNAARQSLTNSNWTLKPWP